MITYFVIQQEDEPGERGPYSLGQLRSMHRSGEIHPQSKILEGLDRREVPASEVFAEESARPWERVGSLSGTSEPGVCALVVLVALLTIGWALYWGRPGLQAAPAGEVAAPSGRVFPKADASVDAVKQHVHAHSSNPAGLQFAHWRNFAESDVLVSMVRVESYSAPDDALAGEWVFLVNRRSGMVEWVLLNGKGWPGLR